VGDSVAEVMTRNKPCYASGRDLSLKWIKPFVFAPLKKQSPARAGLTEKNQTIQRSGGLAQALFHERLALVALFVGGFLVAGFHFFLLGGAGLDGVLFGAQTLFHEGFAFIALFARGLFVASGHFLLLRRELLFFGGVGQTHAASQTQRREQGKEFFHGVDFLGLKDRIDPPPL
jgi:hypothetical protein